MAEAKDNVDIKDTLIDALDEAAHESGSETGEAVPVRVDPPLTEKAEKKVKEAVVSPQIAAAAKALESKAPSQSPGMFVLQWLSYAFWVWFGISLAWLVGVVSVYFVSGSTTANWGTTLAYPLAAVIVMLIISLLTDYFYSKHEAAQKSGGSMVIMMLHAVPMVLIAIGALITTVFAVILMLLNSDPANGVDGPKVTMIVALVVALSYGVMAYRIVFGAKRPVTRPIFWGVMALLAVGFIIAGFAGPAAEAARTKQDRLVETALPSLSDDIRSYAAKNDKLPASLTDVTHGTSSQSQAVQQIIDQKLVTYKANTLPAAEGNSYTPGSSSIMKPTDDKYAGAKRFYYQLCTTFKAEKKNEYNYTQSASYLTGDAAMGSGVTADYRYDSIYSIASHPAGYTCYNLYADGKYGYYDPIYDSTNGTKY